MSDIERTYGKFLDITGHKYKTYKNLLELMTIYRELGKLEKSIMKNYRELWELVEISGRIGYLAPKFWEITGNCGNKQKIFEK